MRSGEVWWARLEERTPVVLLPDGKAIRVVSPATHRQKQGFLVLTGSEATDPDTRRRITESTVAVGAEVPIGTAEGLPFEGVVRVAFPHAGQIFCTWETALTADDLLEQAGTLSTEKQHQLDTVMKLAQSPE
jgi:mRNA interferase MazF